MIRKTYFVSLFSCVLIALFAAAAFAQNSPVSGTVELDNNGTRTPVAGALIEVYRIDIKSGFPSAKTDKRGTFSFAGMPLGGVYAFGVSAPGCNPVVFPDVRAGQEKLLITMLPGDGRKFTEAEVRDAIANRGTGNSGGELSPEDKKKKEEYDKQVAEINAKNEKIKARDAIASKSNDEGRAALTAKNWDVAIAQFSAGVEAVPDFVGSTPIMLLGKMLALKGKGFDIYRAGAALGDMAARREKYNEANKYYDDGLAAFAQALEVLKAAPAPADAVEQKKRDGIKTELYANAAEIHRIKAMGGVDVSRTAEAAKVFTEYIALETDPARKLQAQMNLGDIMRLSGDFDKAAEAYREVLVTKPDHPEAMAGLGLSLFASGAAESPENKEKEQEGLNFMQKYTEIAPVAETDPPNVRELKKSVKEAVDYLKSQKMAPQKVAPTRKKP